jgi:hypothetical protein
MAREILDREIAAREEAERKAARREARRRLPRALRSVFRRPAAADPGKPAELIEPTLNTGELEALMVAPSAVGMWGTSSVPSPRPAAELVNAADADQR